MGKLYAVAYVDKSELRNDKLSFLFEETPINEKDLHPDWFVRGDLRRFTLSNNLLRIKTYKRLNSAEKLCYSLNEKINPRDRIGKDRGIISNKLESNGIWEVFHNDNFKFYVVEISDYFNKSIDEEIKKLTDNHNKRIEKLIKRKI